MLREGTERAEPQHCTHMPVCCWDKLCGSPLDVVFFSSRGQGLSFQGLFWPRCFFCHLLRASRNCNDKYYGVPRQFLTIVMTLHCHDPLYCPLDTVLNMLQCWLPVTSYSSCAEDKRKALPQHSARWLFIPSQHSKAGLVSSWRKRSLCYSRWRGMDPAQKSLSSLWIKLPTLVERP